MTELERIKRFYQRGLAGVRRAGRDHHAPTTGD
jgi:hypothetical protein